MLHHEIKREYQKLLYIDQDPHNHILHLAIRTYEVLEILVIEFFLLRSLLPIANPIKAAYNAHVVRL